MQGKLVATMTLTVALAPVAGHAVVMQSTDPDIGSVLTLGDIAPFDERLSFDIDGDGTDDFELAALRDPTTVDIRLTGLSPGGDPNGVTNSSPGDLGPGDLIGSGTVFGAENVLIGEKPGDFPFPLGNFFSPSGGELTGLIGLAFASGSDLLYGYATVTVNSDAPFSARIDSAFYETEPGTAIEVPGQVPLPASVLLLATGVAAVGALRRARPREAA